MDRLVSNSPPLQIPRTLGRWDLVLLKIVAVVNINNVPPVAVYGWASLGLWGLAFGNGFAQQPVNTLFFTAGPDDEAHGLYGRLDPLPRKGGGHED